MIPCKLLRSNSKLPTKGSKYSAGFDLYYCPNMDNYTVDNYTIELLPHCRGMLPTGISMSIPKGYYGRVAPRSGLALKNGLDVLAGVIDNDFISEVQVILYNTSDTPVNIEPYTRIAQLIIEKCDSFQLFVVDELESTERGENGFGSTGLM